jgi:AbiV family abortive infection protein
MASIQTPQFTPELLRAYADAALSNSAELLDEASLLLEHSHFARAYFLAISSIEEAGKALHAFDAQHRNLKDPAVSTRLKSVLENHKQKINYAFGIWAMRDADPEAALKRALDLALHLAVGREPSMYSEVRTEPDRAQTPREVVREVAAQDCVRLARACLAHAQRHLSEKTPSLITSAQDRLFVMKSKKLQDILRGSDFWWYYIEQMKAGQLDLADAVIGYEHNYLKTGVQFRTE